MALLIKLPTIPPDSCGSPAPIRVLSKASAAAFYCGSPGPCAPSALKAAALSFRAGSHFYHLPRPAC